MLRPDRPPTKVLNSVDPAEDFVEEPLIVGADAAPT